jgi:hypothetical protein
MLVAVVILAGTLSRQWLTSETLHIGPPGVEVCMATITSSGAPGPIACKGEAGATLSGGLEALRWGVLIGGFAAAAACAYYARNRRWFGACLAVCAIAAIAMIAFEGWLVVDHERMTIAYGFPLGGAGVIAGAVMLSIDHRRASAARGRSSSDTADAGA